MTTRDRKLLSQSYSRSAASKTCLFHFIGRPPRTAVGWAQLDNDAPGPHRPRSKAPGPSWIDNADHVLAGIGNYCTNH